METHHPLRVLEVVGAMNRGGIETWLMNVARQLDPAEVEVTFVKHTHERSDYDAEIAALGHRVVVCPGVRNPLSYLRNFRRIVRDEGPFDAVHSQVSNFSGVPLLAARWSGIPTRIAHSQTDRRSIDAASGPARRAYLGLSRALILRSMTRGLGCSTEACLSLFGREPTDDPRIAWLPNGIDPEPFALEGGSLRAELGLAETTKLVGHLGRFVPVKNHDLLIDIAAAWRRRGDDVHLVLAGDGPLRREVESRIQREGLSTRVTSLGLRSDVPDLVASLDAFVLPSHYEGAPITLLEAQASAVPCVVSDAVSRASDVIPELVSRMEPGASADDWAARVCSVVSSPRMPLTTAQQRMTASAWNLDGVVGRLRLYWAGATPEPLDAPSTESPVRR